MSRDEAVREAVEVQREFEAVTRRRRAVFRRAQTVGVSVRELSEATGLTTGRVRGVLGG